MTTPARKARAQKAARRAEATQPRPKELAAPSRAMKASRQRVAVMEALERNGGELKSRNGVQSRLMAIHGRELAGSQLTKILHRMAEDGLIVLEEIGNGPSGRSRKIIELLLVEIPDNFRAPIDRLRTDKGLPSLAPTQVREVAAEPEQPTPAPEPEQPTLTVVSRTEDDFLRRENEDLRRELADAKERLEDAQTTIRVLSRALSGAS